MIKHAKSPDGIIHTIPREDRMKQRRIPGSNDANICLSCTKEKCYGTRKCMVKHKDEQ